MSLLLLIGRIMFAMLFLGSALSHFTQTDELAAYAGGIRGIPRARLVVPILGAAITIGAIALVLGVWYDLAALGLAVFTLSTATLVHQFWRDEGEARAAEQVHFMKDLALAGAGLMLFLLFAAADGAIGLTLTDPVVSLTL